MVGAAVTVMARAVSVEMGVVDVDFCWGRARAVGESVVMVRVSDSFMVTISSCSKWLR